MKQVLSYVIAGGVGAIITLFAFTMVFDIQSDSAAEAGFNGAPATLTSNTSLRSFNRAPEVGFDFTVAAEKSMPTVVQIKAQESEALVQKRLEEERNSNPFGGFFDFGFGDDFFNPFGGGNRPKSGAGSGVIISDDGYIVTNNHVVDFADEVTIKLTDGEEYEARIVGRDASTDLAVLKIDAKNLPAIDFGDSDDVKVGEWVLAVGNPFEYLTSTVTAGIVSAKGRDIDLIRSNKAIEQFIQTDAAINPGNSGGALVDTKGRLIGINTAIASYTGNYAGYSFAIPVNLMRKIVDDIIENGGDIERTSLGVVVEELDDEYAEELGLEVSEGLLVRQLSPGGSAEFAGVLPNDIIVGVDQKEAKTFDDLKEIINYAKVGDTLNLKVLRKGEEQVIPVRLRKGI